MSGKKLILSGAEGRYATALFELAEEAGCVDSVERDLMALGQLATDNAEFGTFISSPVISRAAQVATVDKLRTALEIEALTGKFLMVLAGNGRLGKLPAVARGFAGLAAERRGEVVARVSSARPLTDEQMQELRDQLKAVAGQDVILNAEVDPSLIGGLSVRLGSKMIDGSIRTKLQNLKISMKGAA